MRDSRWRSDAISSSSSWLVQYQPTASTSRLATSAMPAVMRVCIPMLIGVNAIPCPPSAACPGPARRA